MVAPWLCRRGHGRHMELRNVQPVRVENSMNAVMSPARWTSIVIVTLISMRLVIAASTPLHFDEAYYWLWSKNLAGGYYDHPPAVAFVIRLGTMLAGDGELGVRFGSILLALPMTWAVYRTADILFANQRIAMSAAIFLNLTLMVAFGTIIVTPDAPLMTASGFVLYFLAKVLDTRSGAWWLAVGAAAGIALLSKYTALYFGVSISLCLVLVPELRRWLLTPWPYIGGAVAIALFVPTLAWNAQHDWASFYKQFGRTHIDDFTLRYIAELLPAQIGLATPSIFFLGTAGLFAMLYGRGGTRSTRVLLGVMVWPIFIYFVWHSLHARVQGNWLAPIYPAFVIIAAVAAEDLDWQGLTKRLVDHSRHWATAIGVGLFALIGLQASLGVIPLGPGDPTARALAAGFRELAATIEVTRARLGATAIITTSYATTAWLSYYMPPGTTVVQINDRIRWANMPLPNRNSLERALYAVGPDADRYRIGIVRTRYRSFEHVVDIPRMRRGILIDTYQLYLVDGFAADTRDSLIDQPQ
jgi:4-amino-4-deoxy-L-arabinose transferase-like glycosyltransferase